MSGGGGLPRGFRKLDAAARRAALAHALGVDLAADLEGAPGLDELADVMIEHAVGVATVPLGIATGFVVDGVETLVPLATEEPSVVAASSYGALLVAGEGGFTTWATEPLMCAHVYLEGVTDDGLARLGAAESEVRRLLEPHLRGMTERGGGYRAFAVRRIAADLVRAELRLDVRDAFGANHLNSAAEALRTPLESIGGGRSLLAILSNNTPHRLAGARFAMDVEHLGLACPPGMAAEVLARRVARASEVAHVDPDRAVTHNKGILNGVEALALATGNDTRAVGAAAHAWAHRGGPAVGLSRLSVVDGPGGPRLTGEIELPLPLGTVGGSVGLTPSARACLRVLAGSAGDPLDSRRLARIAAAVGLAQNFAALVALAGEGIQRGHLTLHARRLAWKAGARGAEIRTLAERLAGEMSGKGGVDPARVSALLAELRKEGR